jgi:sugar/nucleoside kinase (ribokinase family)
MSFLTIGTVAFDDIDTPFGKSGKIVGGSASYIGLCASYFLPKVNLVAVVGDDFPESMLNEFEKRNINTEGLQIKKGEKSFYWSGKYHNDMNSRDTLVTSLNVLEHFNPVIPESYQDCKYLLLGNLTPKIQLSVLERLRNRPKFIAMDTMNLWIDIALDDLKAVLLKIDMLIVNDEEARQLTKEYSLVKAAKRILAMGPKHLIIKKGEHGALLFSADKIFYAPALPLEEVYDPTGAGDTFAAGFIAFLAQKDDVSFDTMKKAVINGCAMASFTVEKFGVQRLLELDKNAIHERYIAFEELVKF